MNRPDTTLLHFGPFTLDLAAAQLRRDGAAVALRPKAYETLVVLARRPQQLVTKEELLDSVWGRRFITEGVIKACVSELRQALGDDPKLPRWIETVARKGYRFGGAVHSGLDVAAGPAPAAAQAPAVESTNATLSTPPAKPPPTPGHVPVPLAATIGRDAELAALTAGLQTHRLLTVCGPAGMGKTLLALELALAQRLAWRDGVWFVELAPLAPPAPLPLLAANGAHGAALAATLRTCITQTLQMEAGADSSTRAMARALQPLHLLLVLDNAEHLLATLAPLLDTLLAQAPTLHVVVTSQEPLHLAGEQLLRLQPLSVPAEADDHNADQLMASSAVSLFVARVAARLPGFSLGLHQQQAVAQICRELDGLPLALELAAARVPLLGVHGLADILQAGAGQLQLLTQGARTAAPRQRTLRAALEWSHSLLDERQRCVLRRLAVFRSGFAMAQAQAVCRDDQLDNWAVLDAVQALLDKSLLSARASGATATSSSRSATPAAPQRLHMLESVRAFAHEQLVMAGEADRVAARHAAVVDAYWAQAQAHAPGVPALQWLDQHGAETDNLRAALRWALDTQAAPTQPAPQEPGPSLATLVGNAVMLWHRAGLYSEGRGWCDAARSAALQVASRDDPQPGTDGAMTTAMAPGLDLAQAVLALYGNAYPAADTLNCALRAAAGFAASGDAQSQYWALYLVYQASLRNNVHTGAAEPTALLAQMQALEQPGWPEVLTRYSRAVQGYEHRRNGRQADYLAYCSDELARCQRLGAVAESWPPSQGLMLALHDSGQLDAALSVGRLALAHIRAHGRLRQHGAFHALWTLMLAQSGDCPGARHALAEALPMLRGAGTVWMAQVALAWLAAQESRPMDAAQLLGWHVAAQQAQKRAEPGGTIARALQALNMRLHAELGSDQLARQQQLGTALDDDSAERLALAAGPGPAPFQIPTRAPS